MLRYIVKALVLAFGISAIAGQSASAQNPWKYYLWNKPDAFHVQGHGQGIAFVESIEGAADAIQARAILSKGDRIDLGMTGKLTIVHLSYCILFEFEGGTVSIEENEIAGAGKKLLETEINCSGEVQWLNCMEIPGDPPVAVNKARSLSFTPLFLLTGETDQRLVLEFATNTNRKWWFDFRDGVVDLRHEKYSTLSRRTDLYVYLEGSERRSLLRIPSYAEGLPTLDSKRFMSIPTDEVYEARCRS